MLVTAAVRREIRSQQRLARQEAQQCYLVAKFELPTGKVVAMPAATALKARRISSEKGGIPWDF